MSPTIVIAIARAYLQPQGLVMDSRPDTFSEHPCFGQAARNKSYRIHLGVAPRTNARSRFADNNPVRPAMLPEEALDHLEALLAQRPGVDMVSISGPGDPLATPTLTLGTLRLLRAKYPDLPLCLTTRGLGAENTAEELASFNLSHVTLLVDAVTPEVVENIFAWIRPSTKTMPLPEAAGLLVNEQARAVTAFKNAGLTVKIHTMIYPGINAGHAEDIAKSMARLGADIMSITPYTAANQVNNDLGHVSYELLAAVRDRAGKHIRLMPAYETCGNTAENRPEESPLKSPAVPSPTSTRPNVAVVSSDGMEVDLHLGHATKVMIYGPREDGLACLLEMRNAPEPGSGNNRWETLAETLGDCFVLLAASAGTNPRQILRQQGLPIVITDGNVEGTVDVLYGGGKKGKSCGKRP